MAILGSQEGVNACQGVMQIFILSAELSSVLARSRAEEAEKRYFSTEIFWMYWMFVTLSKSWRKGIRITLWFQSCHTKMNFRHRNLRIGKIK